MKKYNNYLLLSAAYIFYVSLDLLILDSVFWDDWTIFNHSFAEVYGMYEKCGGQFLKPFVFFFKQFGSYELYAYKLWAIIGELATSLLFYRFVRRAFNWTSKQSLLAGLLFIIAPLNFSKYLIINSYSTVLLTLFMIALNMYISKNKYIRIMSYLFFTISLYLQSLLVFIFIIPIYKILKHKITAKNILAVVKEDIILFVLPIIVYSIIKTFTSVASPYDGYNAPSVFNGINIKMYLSFFSRTFVKPIIDIGTYNIVFIVLSILGLLNIKKLKSIKIEEIKFHTINKWNTLTFIVSLFVLACFPYIAVGKIPNYIGVRTRHTILLVFFFVFAIIWLVNKIKPEKRLYTIALIFLVSGLIKFNVATEYIKGAIKTDFLVHKLKSYDTDSQYVILEDLSSVKGLFSYSFYSLNGMLREANPDRKYTIVAKQYFSNECKENLLKYFSQWPEYNLMSPDICSVENKYPSLIMNGDISSIKSIYLYIVKIFSIESYFNKLEKMIVLK